MAGTNKSAVTAERRQLLGQRASQYLCDRAIGPPQRRDRLRDIARQVSKRGEGFGEFSRGKNSVPDRGKIARAATVNDNARERAREVGHRFQPRAQVVARGGSVDEEGNGIEPVHDFAWIGQWRGKPLRQKPGAGCRYRAIDRGKHRAAPLAR